MTRPSARVVFDEPTLWTLPAGTHIRELGALGRTFIKDRFEGRAWLSEHPHPLSAIELPVEVTP